MDLGVVITISAPHSGQSSQLFADANGGKTKSLQQWQEALVQQADTPSTQTHNPLAVAQDGTLTVILPSALVDSDIIKESVDDAFSPA